MRPNRFFSLTALALFLSTFSYTSSGEETAKPAYRSAESGAAYRSAESGAAYCSAESGAAYRSAESGAAYRSAESGAAYRSAESGAAYRSAESGAAYRSAESGAAYRSAESGAAYRSAESRAADGSAESSPSRKTQTLYLSGTGSDDPVIWDFKCDKGMNSGKWGKIAVPSQWELQGYGEYTYGRFYTQNMPCSDEQGIYRRNFRVPTSWRGMAVDIVFDGVMTDAEVFINGKSAGPVHQGAFYRFSYRIENLLRYGGINSIEVRVKKQSDNQSVNNAERRADWWLFGGIFRPVWLQARPVSHIEYAAIDAGCGGNMTVDLELEGAPAGSQIRYELSSLENPTKTLQSQTLPTGAPMYSGSGEEQSDDLITTGNGASCLNSGNTKEREQKGHGDTFIRHNLKWTGVKNWDCEHPDMYVLTMSLIHEGNVLHSTEQRIGFRTVELRPQDGLYVNGTKVVLKGVNRHCFHPESGRTTSRSIDLEDAMLIKQMNANAIRSHYPPDARFLDICDSLGIFYLDELAGWHGHYDDNVGPNLVREMVRRDVNHPCVIIWDNGNEGGWNTHLDSLFYALDPQKRHVIHPWADFDNLDTHHYPAYLTGVGRFTNGYKVFMPTEFMHTNYDEGGGAGLEDFWNSWITHPLFAGGFIWAWLDESVVRSDKGGVLDSFMNMGNDGIVGPYREKEGSWWTIRDVWAPIQFDKTYITNSFTGDFLITNKYLFSSLEGCRINWKVKRISTPMETTASKKQGSLSETIASGAMEVPALERDCKGRLHFDLPDNFFEGDILEIEGFDAVGCSICTWTWPIHYAAQYCSNHGITGKEPVSKGISSIEKAGDLVRITNGGTSAVFDSKNGSPIAILHNGRQTHLDKFRPVGMKWKYLSSSVRQEGKDIVYCTKFLGGVDSVVWRFRPDGTVGMDAVILNRDRGGKGFDDAFMDPDVKYLGFTFDLPESAYNRHGSDFNGMTWLGRGPYRVWKNRQRGHNIDLWYKDWNNTITAETDEPHGHLRYPEFKGYHANIYWARLESDFNPITIYSATDGLYLRVFTPEQPHHIEKGSSNPAFPEGDLSLLYDITAIKSFKPIPHQGPHSQSGNVRIKSGDEGLHLSVLFDFSGAADKAQESPDNVPDRGAMGAVTTDGKQGRAMGTVPAAGPKDANGVWDTTLDSLVKAQSARPVPGSSRKGNNPVLFLIGDSTMRTGTLGNGDNGQWGWGFYAHNYFDENRIGVENHALGGTSSRTFYRRLWPAVLEGIRPGDYVIIQLGHNDNGPYDEGRARASIPGTGKDSLIVTIKETGQKETVWSYGEYIRRFISEAESRGAHCLLFTLTPRNSREADGSISRKSKTFDPWLQEVAVQTGVPLIDLESITASRYESYSPWKVNYMFYKDRIHSSAFGAMENARSAAEGIAACTSSDLNGYLLPLEKPKEEVKREPGKPVLFLTGDSTMKNNDSDPDGMWGWGSVVHNLFDDSKITVHNAGKAGRSTRTFLTEGRWDKVYNSIRPGDFVVIQFGHNDTGSITTGRARGGIHGTADTSAVYRMDGTGKNEVVYSYGWYLKKFIDDVREKGGTPLLLSPTPRNEWPEGKMERRDDDLSKWVKEVAHQTGADFIDLLEISASFYDSIGKEAAAGYFKNDHTHSSRIGAERNAQSFAEGLKQTGHPLTEYLKVVKK